MSSTVVLAATALAVRLEPAARALDATGLTVWACNRDRRVLSVLASHGYSESFLARIGAIPVDAPVMTALVFAERRTATRPMRVNHSAAVAVPVISHGQTVGVLTAEFDASRVAVVSAEVVAEVEALAVQVALLVLTAAPEAGRPAVLDRRHRVVEPSVKRAARLAPVRPMPAAISAALAQADREDSPQPAVDTRDDPEDSLREARSRFISGFRKRRTTIEELVAEIEQRGSEGPVLALKQIVHRLASVASVVGLAGVSEHATALDRLLEMSPAVDAPHVRRVIGEMQDAFTDDLAGVPPLWAAPPSAAEGSHVLVVMGDRDEAARMTDELRGAAYRVTATGSGSRALGVVRADRPSVVLLDVDLAGDMDGHDVCLQLKSDPSLADIPVVLVASHASTVERMAGYAQGADDYLTKPVQPVEMLLRVRWMLTRPRDEQPAPRAGGGLMSSESFVAAAREALHAGPAALALVRIAPSAMSDFAALFGDDLRRKDLLGRYSETQLVVLMPNTSAGVAAKRIGAILDTARAAGLDRSCAGLTASGQSAERFIETLLAQAEAALSAAQVQGRPVVLYGAGTAVNQATVLVVDDDPDVVHIVDARLKAAGHKTIIAFDGEAALDAVDTAAPAVMVLELVLPKRSGFDVLARLREQPEPRPRVIVVSSRTREEDVMRAFELGADDYLTKPFSPQELLARVARLLR